MLMKPELITSSPKEKNNRGRNPKIFTLDDGTTGSAKELAAMVKGGCSPATISARLQHPEHGTDPEYVLAPVKIKSNRAKT